MVCSIVINWEPNRALVTSLSQAGVRFIILGSTALRYYAPEKTEPNDLDLLVEPSLAALGSFSVAAAPYGFSFSENLSEAHLTKPNLGFPAKTQRGFGLNVDVFVKAEGFDFQEHWSTAREAVMTSSQTVVRVAAPATLDAWLQRALRMEPSRAEKIRQDLNLLRRVQAARR